MAGHQERTSDLMRFSGLVALGIPVVDLGLLTRSGAGFPDGSARAAVDEMFFTCRSGSGKKPPLVLEEAAWTERTVRNACENEISA